MFMSERQMISSFDPAGRDDRRRRRSRAGAVVTRDVPAGATGIGNPARVKA